MDSTTTNPAAVYVKAFDAVTHSGAFHADDTLAAAVFKSLFETPTRRFEILRTRDTDLLGAAIADNAIMVFDVGGVCNVDEYNFDHHQTGGAGKRENGIPFSSFGLVWKTFGAMFCCRLADQLEIDTMALANMIDAELVQGIDAIDCGNVDDPNFRPNVGEVSVEVQSISSVISDLNPQPLLNDKDYDTAFLKAVEFASLYLRRFTEKCAARLLGAKLINAGRRVEDRIVVVNATVPDWSDVVCDQANGFPEAMYYLEPDNSSTTGGYMIWQVPTTARGFKGRKSLPATWAGLRGEALEAVTGISGSGFCHGLRFVGGGNTLEAAIAMAKAAIAAE